MPKLNLPQVLILAALTAIGASGCASKPAMTNEEMQDVNTQYRLGTQYKTGDGVEQDYAQARAWYQKAAEQGSSAAQNNLGVMYQRAEGVDRDYVQAYHWFKRAAEAGNMDAQHNLADLYRHGYGVPQDFSYAVNWYTRAAMQGDVEAQNKLAEMYYNGEGVAQDYKKAYTWAALAATQHPKNASKLRDRAAGLIGLDELVAAQKESTALFETIQANTAPKK